MAQSRVHVFFFALKLRKSNRFLLNCLHFGLIHLFHKNCYDYHWNFSPFIRWKNNYYQSSPFWFEFLFFDGSFPKCFKRQKIEENDYKRLSGKSNEYSKCSAFCLYTITNIYTCLTSLLLHFLHPWCFFFFFYIYTLLPLLFTIFFSGRKTFVCLHI